MKAKNLLRLAACVFPAVNAVFSDEAFHLDYHHALLGIPQSHTTFFHKPQTSSNASLLYTISDKAVLGAVNPKDGSLLWRQLLAGNVVQDASHTYLVAGDDGKVVSGYGSHVSAWDAFDGRLVWEIKTPSVIRGLQKVPREGGSLGSADQDVILLAGPSESVDGVFISRVSGDGSGSKWEYKDTSLSYDTSISITASAKHVYYITKSSGLLSGGKAKVTVLSIDNGSELSHYSIAVDSEPLGNGGSYSVDSCSGSPFIISSEPPYKSIKFNLLGNQKVSTLTLEDKGEAIEEVIIHQLCKADSAPHFVAHVKTKTKQWAEVFHVNTKTVDATKMYSLPATAESSVFAGSVIDDSTYIARITDSEISLYSSESHGQLGRWTVDTSGLNTRNIPLHAAVEVSSRGKNLAIRAATTSTATGWTLLQNGQVQWSRPEMLAYITRSVWSENVKAASLAHEIEVEAASNPLSAYLHRLTRHALDLTGFPKYLSQLPATILQPADDTGDLTRKTLVGGKLVLATTSRQELFALDAADASNVKWRIDLSRKLKAEATAVELSVEETRVTVYLSDGSLAVADIPSGELLEIKQTASLFNKIVEIPGTPAATIIKVSSEGTPELFSDLAPPSPSEGNTLVTISEKGEAIGWTIGNTIEKMWTIQPRNSAKIVSAVARPAYDPVASIGKVLGDRSVLYKYVTPNIVLLTALSSTTLTIYLVNAVTGAILYTASHDGVSATLPTPSVISENWFAYSFTSQDPTTSGLYTQLIITELYESGTPNDRGLLSSQTNYSSYSPDASTNPYVVSQSYTISEPISNLTVSQTLQGIATRHVLATLPNSNAILSIPREILNARRPVDRDPTALEMEEGLMRYMPILDLDPKFYLTHSREVIGIQKLMSAPTLLESTSMIFAYGHDIFGTQLNPSNAFDVLGKGFKRIQLVLTVIALYLGVLAVRPIVRKKMVERRWS